MLCASDTLLCAPGGCCRPPFMILGIMALLPTAVEREEKRPLAAAAAAAAEVEEGEGGVICVLVACALLRGFLNE